MAKLLTHHDRFHIHGLLGLCALWHFAYRFIEFFLTLQDPIHPGWLTACFLLVHCLLHVTSFQFFLPQKMQTKPMIWPEFRGHNAIFAYRNLLGTAFAIWTPHWWLRSVSVSAVLLKLAIVLSACKLADMVTDRLGSRTQRTTNSMPYPEKTPTAASDFMKGFYAKAQFAATAGAIFGTPMLAFGSVLGIEIASFLMTLVRKGLIDSRTYHLVYSASLALQYVVLMVSISVCDEMWLARALSRCAACCASTQTMRVGLGMDKYLSWSLGIIAGIIVGELVPSIAFVQMAFFVGLPMHFTEHLVKRVMFL